jgi:histidinol-phosphate aminotransferase
MDPLVRDSVRRLPHVTAPQPPGGNALRLDANTNLYGPNPAIRKVLEREAAGDFSLYPAPLHDALRNAIATRHALEPSEVLVGAGADELIDVAIRAFVNPGDPVAIAVPTFELYAFCAKVEHAEVIEIPMGQGFRIDVDGMLRARAKVTFVASPNNPTGNAQPVELLERLIRESRGIVVIDEAYAEYGAPHLLGRVREFPNLIVLRTFSKAYGLAGLRVGFAAATGPVVESLLRVKIPFTVGELSERIALEALANEDHVAKSRKMVDVEKPRLTSRLSRLGLHPFPSDANFLLVRVGERVEDLARHLADRGIAVRVLPKIGCFRVTVGRAEHNDRLLSVIGEYLK